MYYKCSHNNEVLHSIHQIKKKTLISIILGIGLSIDSRNRDPILKLNLLLKEFVLVKNFDKYARKYVNTYTCKFSTNDTISTLFFSDFL